MNACPHPKRAFCSIFAGIVLFGGIGEVLGGETDSGAISEIRLGMLDHDTGVFGDSVEDGVDANLELLFRSPELLDGIGSPRPFLGANINSEGNTNQLYFGVDWRWDLTQSTFAEFEFGGSFHDGEDDVWDQSRKELGCTLLLRFGVDAGYRFDRHHALMLHMDHASNADICEHNDGTETLGLRYGYTF